MTVLKGRASSRPVRVAFTLVELLVVIAIITILVSLTAAAVFKVSDLQVRLATDRSLTKLHSELDQQIKQTLDQVRDDAKNQKWPANIMTHPSVQGNQDKARDLLTRLKMKQEFPVTFTEAINDTVDVSVALPKKPIYVSTVAAVTATGYTVGSNPNFEAAVCLTMALNQARRTDPPKLEETLGTSVLRTINGGKVVVDSWDVPIKYVRGTNEQTPDVISAGPDKTFGGTDDRHSNTLR